MTNLEVIINPQSGTITTNFEDLKAAIAEHVSEFNTATFTEDSKAIAKKHVASLRAWKKAINEKRIKAKKIYMQPFDRFEAQCKELQVVIDEPIEHINAQVEAFEEKRKKEKQDVINALYAELIGSVGEYLPLERIQSDKWLNSTTKEKAIREELKAAVERINSDLEVIRGMESEVEDKALAAYKRDLQLSTAIQLINNYERQKADILRRQEAQQQAEAERKAEQERERIRREERRRVAEEAQIKEVARQEVVQEITSPITDEIVKDAKVTAVYTVSASEAELEEIEMLFNSLGVTFEKKNL